MGAGAQALGPVCCRCPNTWYDCWDAPLLCVASRGEGGGGGLAGRNHLCDSYIVLRVVWTCGWRSFAKCQDRAKKSVGCGSLGGVRERHFPNLMGYGAHAHAIKEWRVGWALAHWFWEGQRQSVP